MENISTNNMYEHVKSIKNSCDKYRKENGVMKTIRMMIILLFVNCFLI